MTTSHRDVRRDGTDAPAAASMAKRSILCVQPNADYHPALELALSKYRVVMATCALDALRAHNAATFDAYVVDYWLPDWSGVGLCRQIRQSEPHAPICFFTAADRDDQKNRALRAGANVFLSTTAGASVLAARIRSLLHVAEARSFAARLDGERAIHEELRRRAALVVGDSERARQRAADAMERSAQARARKAFTAAGGSLAVFDRIWPQTYASVAAAVRVGAETTARAANRDLSES